MISVEFVDALRRERLQEFDVLTDLDRLQSEVSDTRTAWESEVANLKGRIKILETAIVELIAAARERTVTLAAQGAWEERHLRSTAASLGLSAHESQVDPNT